MWSNHGDEPMHHHAVTDRPAGRRHQLRQSGPSADRRSEARAVTASSSAKLMSFVVRCGANGAHELKKIALGRSGRPLKPAVCCCCWRGGDMQNQMTADHTLREPDRRLMQLARRPTDNATTVASTGRPKHRSSEANSIILRFTMFLFTRCNTEMVLLNLLQCMPE